MDKEIIIDGVDVSGCKNFSCGKCEEENKIPITINHFTADCRMYPNCYYKQLSRKEQECRYWFRPNPSDYRKCSLRGKNDNCDEINDCFIKELLGKLARKEQEYEELKESLKVWKYSDVQHIFKINKYEQTLTEIKAIAEIKIDCKQYEIDHDCFNDTRCKALKELIETLQEILGLITKAEEE